MLLRNRIIQLTRIIPQYLKSRRIAIVVFLVFISIFYLISLLYRMLTEPVIYALEIVIVIAFLAGTYDLLHFSRRHRLLADLIKNIAFDHESLPQPADLIESDYQAMIGALAEELTNTRSDFDVRRGEMTDYYTIWAHQIKTPISALRLLISSGDKNIPTLEQELFKIEQYTDMVLCYLRSESLSADLILQPYSIDAIVRQAVKKYAVLFIGKKISLQLESLDETVVTDEKWLSFVIEQLLSNALKYTPENGKISIYMHGSALTIEDNGIGILPEDLPRIFDRGFTGHNGRANKKSTGIGLYLCKRILKALNHPISVESEVGSGTRFSVDLSQPYKNVSLKSDM